MHHRISPTRPDPLWTLRGIALVLAVFVTACDGKMVTPTAPTQTQSQPATSTPVPTPLGTPAAKLVDLWWDDASQLDICTSSGDCQWGESIQNTGPVCASGTTAVLRLSSGNPPQYGAHDYPMDLAGGGLAAKVIRPNEIVAILSVGYVPKLYGSWYYIDLKWNNVACPEG